MALNASTQNHPHSPYHILVVDDDGDVCLLNETVLKHSGYAVDTAKDGAAGWDALCTNGYDLLITDNEMPKVTGIDLLKKLQVAGMVLPVILATGKPPTQELERNPRLRPTAMLLKPYTIDELLTTVRTALRANSAPYGQNVPPPDLHSQASAGGQRPG